MFVHRFFEDAWSDLDNSFCLKEYTSQVVGPWLAGSPGQDLMMRSQENQGELLNIVGATSAFVMNVKWYHKSEIGLHLHNHCLIKYSTLSLLLVKRSYLTYCRLYSVLRITSLLILIFVSTLTSWKLEIFN